jgi:hypothetical protein
MAANSKHYGDIYSWIERVIDSCDNPLQEATARNLIDNFSDRLRYSQEVPPFVRYDIITKLTNRISEKWPLAGRKLIKG